MQAKQSTVTKTNASLLHQLYKMVFEIKINSRSAIVVKQNPKEHPNQGHSASIAIKLSTKIKCMDQWHGPTLPRPWHNSN
jgi:hypothetical protein